MAYFIGTDEAGYGPNLGPLVITATVWRTSGDSTPETLYELLADCVCRSPDGDSDGRLVIADSKELYQPVTGLTRLERGVATALRACGCPAKSWREVWLRAAGLDAEQLGSVPWHVDYDHDLPIGCAQDDIESAAGRFRAGLAQAGLELISVHCAAVFPGEFNQLVDRYGNKSSVLSQCTLELVRRVLASCHDATVIVSCDKHGGRNRYGPILQELFPDYLVEVRRESRSESVYRWGTAERRIEFQFNAKGERLMTAALASMVSKYLRELAMRAFNAYWAREVPGLRPTAGYPGDSRRFKRDIAQRQQTLGIPDAVLWRLR